MKNDRIIWGMLLLFIGGVLLLENFGVIDFYWRSVWRLWPFLLITAGVGILFKNRNEKLGNIISFGLMLVFFVLAFIKGQEPRKHRYMLYNETDAIIDDVFSDGFDDEDAFTDTTSFNMMESLSDVDTLKKVVFNVYGGGVSLKMDNESNELVEVDLKNEKRGYSLSKEIKDSAAVVTFKNASGNQKWNLNDVNGTINLRMNTKPKWDVNLKIGAGEADFDLENYKIERFNFDGGAASVDVKLGDLLPVSYANIKTGMADVTLRVSKNSGTQIKINSGLSARDFPGFVKMDDGTYQSPNYEEAKNKVFIKLDGGLSNFKVQRY